MEPLKDISIGKARVKRDKEMNIQPTSCGQTLAKNAKKVGTSNLRAPITELGGKFEGLQRLA